MLEVHYRMGSKVRVGQMARGRTAAGCGRRSGRILDIWGRAWEVLQRRPLETTLDTGGSHCRLLLSPSIKLMGIRRNG